MPVTPTVSVLALAPWAVQQEIRLFKRRQGSYCHSSWLFSNDTVCDSLNAASSNKGSIRGIILFKVSLNDDSGISFIEISPNIRLHGKINGTTSLPI